jgi:organic radical activating enzyme
MHLRRTTLVITQRCTLKCKLCLAFMPYYENPVHTTYEQACRIVDNYFKIVEQVGIFSVTGGEPLMNPELVPIIEHVLKYSDQIDNSIDIVTNGTIMFKEELLDFLQKNNTKMRIIISNYGTALSTKVKDIEDALKRIGVTYRIQNYDLESDEWTYDGWVDFTDYSLKHDTEEKLKRQGARCIFRQGHYWVINDGELHPCSRQYWRMREGIIPKEQDWYIDLNVLKIEAEKEDAKLERLEHVLYLKSCAYCNGVYQGIERHKPAEQL